MRVPTDAPPGLSPKQRYTNRVSALTTERGGAFAHWQELSDYIKPRRGRFLSNASTRQADGYKRNDKIVNSTPTLSSRVLAAGMMAGITSPARPWFRLTTPDPGGAKSDGTKQWLHEVEDVIRLTYARSNIYQGLHMVYSDLGDFGVTAMLVEEDEEDIIRSFVLPIGQYYLAISDKMRVDTVYRELALTARQLKRMFKPERLSRRVHEAIRQGRLDERFDVLHVVEPNDAYEQGQLGPAGMKWRSCWLETKAAEGDGAPFLREGGFEEFPFMCPRWEINDEDVYAADCPGMVALGDSKALQVYEKRKAELVDKLSKPPMTGPSSMRNQRISLLPGDMNYVDAHNSAQTFRPAIEINPAALPAVEASIREHEMRIKRAYYADLWLALLDSGTGQMTAREVAERHEEKMLQLGPVMERLQDELLDPLIDRTFAILWRNGMIPEPPPELQGMELRVEYISIMAQAQKMLGTGAIERLVGFAGSIAAVVPEVVDKIDIDKVIDEYASSLGTKPDLVRGREAVEALRKARADAQAQANRMQQASVAAQGAKTLSETKLDEGDNALNRLVNQVAPTAAVQ